MSNPARWRNAKLWAATGLLPLGVSLVAATAETHTVAWSLAGYACLLFVPALIIDVIVDTLRDHVTAEHSGQILLVPQQAVSLRFAEDIRAELLKRQSDPGPPPV